MPDFKPPEGEVAEILEAMDMDPNGFAVELQNEDTIALIHYKTHLEVTIRKGVKKKWLLEKKPCLPG